jgi:putative ABC transport system permease protein
MYQDFVIAVRSFLRSPRFTIPAVLALALGIGATAAIFSVVRGVVLKPLPYRDPDRIVVVWENRLKRNQLRNVVAPANFAEWLTRNRSFSHLAMVGPSRLSVMSGTRPEEISGLTASSEIFPVLGISPALGRAYTGAEDLEGHDRVIVLGDNYWRSHFGASPDVLGKTLMADGVQRTIIGVMPRNFTVVGEEADFLIPYGWTMERLRSALGRGASHGIARLRDGVSIEQAAGDMRNLMSQLEREAPRRNTDWSVTLVPVHEQLVDQIRPALLILSGAVALVLLIACVNVANLLLARSTVRQREIGIRSALGARRGRLVRQLLTESVLLGLAGGVAGLTLAFVFQRGLVALATDRIPIPRLDQVALDLPVLLFALVLSLATGLIFGVVPAVVGSSGVSESLREGGRHGGSPRSRRALGTLVVAEVAISLVLLAGAGLLIRSFMRLQAVDPGFRANGILTARVNLPRRRYEDNRQSAAFYSNAIARVSQLPGVRSAAGVSFLPFSGPGIGTSFYVDGTPEPAPGQSPTGEIRPVTPSFFQTMGIPRLAGRDFSDGDTLDSPRVAIISASLARRYFSGENPIGKRLNISIGDPKGGPWEIVGIVGDVQMASLDREMRPAVFLPHTQLAIGLMTLVVRSDVDPMSLVSGVAASVRALDPELPLADVRTMEDVVDLTLSRPRAVATLLTAFAVMALILAGVGVYGVMAYSVAQRTQEIGVRMALGATPRAVFGLVLGHAMRLVAIGVVAGLLAAAALTSLLETLLFEIKPMDPWTLGTTAVVLIAVATLASYIPARRGTRVAPVEALRAE